MPGWRLREFHEDDLDGILRLWATVDRPGSEPVYGLAEVLASCQKDHAIVAVHGDDVVGAAVGRAAHAQGWIVFCATADGWHDRGIGAGMLAALEKRMAPHGLTKLSALVPDSPIRVDAFVAQGFEMKSRLRYFERRTVDRAVHPGLPRCDRRDEGDRVGRRRRRVPRGHRLPRTPLTEAGPTGRRGVVVA